MNTIALINTRAEVGALKSKAKPKFLVLLSRIPRDKMPGMYEQLRQEAANRDGMITKEDKAQEKAADIERMKRRLFESNKSTDPRLVPGIVSQSVPLMTTVGQH